MNNRPPPGKKRISDWLGMRVQSVVPLATSLGELPAGTKWTVIEAFHGLSIKSDGCACCGLQMFVRHVETKDVMPVQPPQREAA